MKPRPLQLEAIDQTQPISNSYWALYSNNWHLESRFEETKPNLSHPHCQTVLVFSPLCLMAKFCLFVLLYVAVFQVFDHDALFKGMNHVQNEPTLLTIRTDEFGVTVMTYWIQCVKYFELKAAFFDILSPYFSYDKVIIM
jgi:hypothetical protein